MINIEDFKTQLRDAARPNRFLVHMNSPAYFDQIKIDTKRMKFLCKGGQIPSRDIGAVEIRKWGQTLKIAGDTLYEELSLIFVNDLEWNARNYFEKWMNDIIDVLSNNRQPASQYLTSLTVDQLGYAYEEGNPIARYQFEYAYPKSITGIDLSMDSESVVEEFTVNFAYAKWTRIDFRGLRIGLGSS